MCEFVLEDFILERLDSIEGPQLPPTWWTTIVLVAPQSSVVVHHSVRCKNYRCSKWEWSLKLCYSVLENQCKINLDWWWKNSWVSDHTWRPLDVVVMEGRRPSWWGDALATRTSGPSLWVRVGVRTTWVKEWFIKMSKWETWLKYFFVLLT